MSHRIIISSAIKALFQEPEVRTKLTSTQLARADHICTHADISDDDFRYLTRRLNQVFCKED